MASAANQKASIDLTIDSSSSSDETNNIERTKTSRKVFKFKGAPLPSDKVEEKSVSSIYNPIPTKIIRPESDCEEWKEFFDTVDEFLVPVNRSRQLVFIMTLVASCVVLTMIAGLFTFVSALWEENNRLLLALYTLIGFSIIPVTLLSTTRFNFPSRVHNMADQVRQYCKQEAIRRTENGRANWKIGFHDRGEKGYRILVSKSETSVSVKNDLCDMA